jgi:hypothetical protein
MSPAIVFASMCPRCKREQSQDGFTVADLMRLLYGGYPIEAYCLICDQFWPISIQQRVELGEVVAVTCRGALPLKLGAHLSPHPSEE